MKKTDKEETKKQIALDVLRLLGRLLLWLLFLLIRGLRVLLQYIDDAFLRMMS